MDLIIKGIHMELTADLKAFIEAKIRDKVDRIGGRIALMEVILDKVSEHHAQGQERVRVVAWVPSGTKTRDGKKRLTVEATAPTMHEAINRASKEILRRVHDWLDEQKPTKKAHA